ncbi:helix-turn-helix domain-containing protein [Kordiimonas aquimaris]|uniref:helix-turn-helix domain-containing protein n=1 Tax=Kordiimonas aquimaris TaxID=707591 RepID=UPI0021D0FFF3|nr:helix-turn-helix domain-containing protein [Kordiimonas aquimaris]
MKTIPEMPFVNNAHDGEQLVMNLHRVPDEATLITARFFEDAALTLRKRHKIWQRYQAIKRHAKSMNRGIARSPIRVLDKLQQGLDFDTAAQVVADEHGIPRETIHRHWLKEMKALEAKAKEARNAEIISLYKSGSTDMEIADIVSLSDRQVRRIIRDFIQKQGNNAD